MTKETSTKKSPQKTGGKPSKKGEPKPEQATANQEEQPVEVEESESEKYAALEERHLRLRAEYDNFMRRTQQERAELVALGGNDILLSLLKPLDDLERTVASAEGAESSIMSGLNLILDNYRKTLESHGVTPFVSVGQSFDTAFHEALMRQPSEEVDEGIILSEHEKGYMRYDKVLRHAKVVVSG